MSWGRGETAWMLMVAGHCADRGVVGVPTHSPDRSGGQNVGVVDDLLEDEDRLRRAHRAARLQPLEDDVAQRLDVGHAYEDQGVVLAGGESTPFDLGHRGDL